MRLGVLETAHWKTSAGIGLIFHSDIGNWLADSVVTWKIPRRRKAPSENGDFRLENGLAGSPFSRRILENGWLAGKLRFPIHDV